VCAKNLVRLDLLAESPTPISVGSPWQNRFAERLIGTIRRECVDHLIVFGEAHLRRVLVEFAPYYNGSQGGVAKVVGIRLA
jgi:hypothetical protein